MGALYVKLQPGIEVHVKFNVHTPEGWNLWCSLWIDGEYIDGDSGPIVEDLDDATLIKAAKEWYTQRTTQRSN